MLDLILGWIRARVKAAALAGLSDALGELQAGDHDEAAATLTLRLKALPPPSEEEAVASRRKK